MQITKIFKNNVLLTEGLNYYYDIFPYSLGAYIKSLFQVEIQSWSDGLMAKAFTALSEDTGLVQNSPR